RWPDGRIENERPLEFLGLGHFGQVIRDIEKANGYGCNIIQIEFGPASVLVGEDKISTEPIEGFLAVCDRAAKANVAVNLLVSPHYFPDWAYEKWPHLRDGGGGFLKVDVQASEARQVYEKFLRVTIPRIKDHPALHSICLSNEPVYTEGHKSQVVRQKWHEWLAARYGTVDVLNKRWGADYADFASIPPVSPDEFTPAPIAYDFVRFNCEAFAEFHAWMAGVIRQMAPKLPLHAKIMICPNFQRHGHGPWSVSPELFAQFSDFNGNDAWKNYVGRGPWANQWQDETMGYDFQRSMADRPVFNSENHLIPDRNFEPVPPEHIANVYWQGAIHGQGATTTWVWERTYSYTDDTSGSIMHRPACVEAMGRTGLDLMRLATEVTAFQRMPIEAVLVWSPASIVAGQEYLNQTRLAYEALNFQGIRIGFVTERQLAQAAETGELPAPLGKVKVIVAAGAIRTPETTLAALAEFRERGGKVLCLGECFTHDEYGRKREKTMESVPLPATSREAFDLVGKYLAAVPLQGPARLETQDGKPVWGVEYLAVRHQGRLLVNLANYLNEPQRVRVLVGEKAADGKAVGGTDLLGGQAIGETFDLPPLQPVLLDTR
ncbi:MAG: beta-galactosidase, partial [Planctomycetia bacterium]|nr:beta-galactosidase [Planctomycetia bacterium]